MPAGLEEPGGLLDEMPMPEAETPAEEPLAAPPEEVPLTEAEPMAVPVAAAPPSGPAAQLVAMCEVAIGYVMLGGLLSIFANKMARRAD